jgi:uncharacterized NAD(P)/FAD-binding protein YdhS
MSPITAGAPLRVLVVGGGASGVLLATQLLRKGGGHVAVRIVERAEALGCGLAYATRDPAHLLNTRVANMSAYPQLPDHFLDWLRAREPALASPQGFVPRATYGRYMRSLLEGWEEDGFACLRDECVALEVRPDGVAARLAGGGVHQADLAVLATGHALPRPRPGGGGDDPLLSQPWDEEAPPRDAAVLIVGSGLTMVDQVLSLLADGHEGPITAVSRRGLLPQVHAPTDPVCWRAGDLPEPAEGVAGLMRWVRAEVRAREAEGGDWRDVVDGLRPHLQALWRGLPPAARQSFLRHASAHWEVHRHRMPPSSHRRLALAQAEGRLRLVRARFEGAERAEGRLEGRLGGQLRARLTGPGGAAFSLLVDRIVDGRGIRRDPEAHATPLVADLLARGLARIDPLRIGLDVAPDCAVLGRDGTPSGRLFALGPASRAAFWEITAIPDIRAQAQRLADRLLEAVPA